MEKEVTEKRLDTYQVNEATFIPHPMNVDDILIFSKANPKSQKSIKNILRELSQFTGLDVNNQKVQPLSKVCEGKTKLHDRKERKSYNQCLKLIQPIENLLSRWSDKSLPYEGRFFF